MRSAAALLAVIGATVLLSHAGFAASHREAPIMALDHKADITDWYAFVSYDDPTKVTMILNVDPFLEPANGPNYFPFDPGILYEMKIDNNHDGVEDVVLQFRFSTEQRLGRLYTVYAGSGNGIGAPFNSPPPVPPGTPLIPPRITSFDHAGLGQIQTYTVTMVNRSTGVRTELTSLGGTLFAVPANVGPRTMDYASLYRQGIYDLGNGIKTFAGTVDDPFYIDLGGFFDTVNTHASPILTPDQDAAPRNVAPDFVSGYAVNSIAIEVPITMLTRTGNLEPAGSPSATIGTWATTSRPRTLVRRSPMPSLANGNFVQVQRMGNPLINEVVIGTGKKDRFSMDQPKNDNQFADFFLDPSLARVVNALTGGAVAIPTPARVDLLPLVSYRPPIASPGTPAGPIADLLRLNTGIPATPPANASRLGLLGGDPAGFPNGRRVFDDVTDIALRVVVGGVLAAPFPGFTPGVNDRLGDGVNVNDAPYQNTFPYVAFAPSGRDRRHIDPGENGSTPPGDGTPTIVFGEIVANPVFRPTGAVAWRVRNPEIGHIDGPFALPGSPPLGLPVADPCVIHPTLTRCVSTARGGSWADPDLCPFIHLHGFFEGHDDPAPGPPTTTSACGHGGLEWGVVPD